MATTDKIEFVIVDDTAGTTGRSVSTLTTLGKAVLANLTTANVSSMSHGLCPALSSVSTTFLSGDGTFATPSISGGIAWGAITGTLASQTDVQAALDAKATLTHGYLSHDASVASLTAGRIPTYNLATGVANANVFFRGDATWATPTVIWGSITGVLASQTDLQTALNAKATLTHGYTSHDGSVASLTAGMVPTYQLGTGTPGATTFLRGDRTYAVPAGINPFTTQYTTLTNATSSATAFSSLNYIGFTLAANSRYIIEGFFGFVTAAVTTGINLAWRYPAGTTFISQGLVSSGNITGNFLMMEAVASSSGASTGVFNLTRVNPGYVWALASTTATGGALTPMMASEIGGSFATINAGSMWRMMST